MSSLENSHEKIDERRPVVRRQCAVVGNKIAVVVDHVNELKQSAQSFKKEPPSFVVDEAKGPRIKPIFRLESTEANPFDSDTENYNYKNEDEDCIGAHAARSKYLLTRQSLSVEMAASVNHRRTSDAIIPSQINHRQPTFASNPMRNSVSTSHLPSLEKNFHSCVRHSNSYNPTRLYPRISSAELSEPQSMGGSYESLPDVCLTTPSGAKKPLTSPQLSSIPAHVSPGIWRPSSTPGHSNIYKSKADTTPNTIHKGCASASVYGPTLGSLFTRQSIARSSWGGEEFFINKASSVDLLSPPGNANRSDHFIKHLKTEQIVAKHAVKTRLSKLQLLLDKAFALINIDNEKTIDEGLSIVHEVMSKVWHEAKIGLDVAYGLCDYVREAGYLDILCNLFLKSEKFGDSCATVQVQTCKSLERCLSACNRAHIFAGTFVEEMIPMAMKLTGTEATRVVVHFLETLFKHSCQASLRLIELSALDYLLKTCQSTSDVETQRFTSVALANLAMYMNVECQKHIMNKNVPDWLFLLASSRDNITCYYACLAICALVSNKEMEAAVVKSGTLALVEPFLLCHKPQELVIGNGRPKEFLQKLVQMLNGKRREPRSLAAFHFAMDASIKQKQDRLDVLREIGAVEALKQVAALPEDVAPKFAVQALEIIGEELPHKLCQQVPLWTVEDVQYWLCKIGFEEYAPAFAAQRVDGDLLLLTTSVELENDIGIKSSLLRRRFIRELDSLKIAADYSCVDITHLDRLLLSIDPRFSIYTYKLLEMGVDCSTFAQLSDEILRNHIDNPVHRMKLCQWMEDSKHVGDMEVALLSKQMDVFISYRRSTGNQLASLLKVLLQLRGYKIFIDVDRLYAGKFDCSLLKNIQAAKHFILVLTPLSLDRCIGDDDCSDWVHKEIICAIEHNKNVIPILDPQFQWPDESKLPRDMRALTKFNGVHWVHEYQDACVDKVEKFIKGELNIRTGLNMSAQRGKTSVISYRHSRLTSNNFSGSNSGSNNNVFFNDAAADIASIANHSRNPKGASLEQIPTVNDYCADCDSPVLCHRS